MILKNSAFLAVFSVLSVLLGIFRDRLLAQYVGIGQALDVYNASFRIPDLALGIMLSFASASTVVPFLTKEFKEGKHKELENKFMSLFFFFSGSMVIVLVIAMAALPLYARLIVPGFTEGQVDQFIFFTRILSLQPILLGVSALIACLGQLRNEFIFYGLAPLLYTLVIITSIVYLYPIYGVLGIIFGVVLGAFFHFVLQLFTLSRIPYSILRGRFSRAYIKEHLTIAVPRSGTYIISNLRIVFFTGFATTFGPGVLSVFLFAQKIVDAFIQVLAQSISIASLPNLSSSYALGHYKEYRSLVKKYSVFIALGAGALTVFALCFGDFIVTILYGTTTAHASIVSMFMLLVLPLPLHAVNLYVTHAFSAMKNTRMVFLSNAIATSLGISVALMLQHLEFGTISIPIAFGVLTVTNSLLLLYFYTKNKYIAHI